MDRRLFKAYGAGCARSLVVQIVVGVVALCILPAIILVSMLMPLPPELEEYRPILWAFGFVAFLGLFTVAAVAWMLWSKRQRAGQFDEAFATLGLSGSNYMLVGRQYHGQVDGRQVDIYFYRGPILDIYLASPLRTRMGVGLSSALSSAASNLLTNVDGVWSDLFLALPLANFMYKFWGRIFGRKIDPPSVPK